MFHQSLGDLERLQELGYKSAKDVAFVRKLNISPEYLSKIVHRDFFKQEYFDYTTNCISKKFPDVLDATLQRGKEKIKAMQIVLPEQVGKALTQRKIGISGDSDDEDFRNDFFGMGSSTGRKK